MNKVNILQVELQMVRMSMRSDLESLLAYLDDIHEYNRKRKLKIEADYAKLTSELDKDDYSQAYEDTYERLKSDFPRVINHTTFISLYSVFETTLKHIYQFVYEFKKGEQIIPLNKSSADYYRELKALIGLEAFQDFDGEFQDIERYKLVRNSLMHNSAVIKNSKNPDQLKAFLDTHLEKITLNQAQTEFSISESSFVSTFGNMCEKFLLKLFEKMRSSIRITGVPIDNSSNIT